MKFTKEERGEFETSENSFYSFRWPTEVDYGVAIAKRASVLLGIPLTTYLVRRLLFQLCCFFCYAFRKLES